MSFLSVFVGESFEFPSVYSVVFILSISFASDLLPFQTTKNVLGTESSSVFAKHHENLPMQFTDFFQL